jgi:hypothetical protein
MLLSHKYKFIFIKTRKTAGTSVEIELSKLMSDKDIVTTIKPEHKTHMPRNYIYNGKKLFNHIMMSEVEKIIPYKITHNYFKFCIEREPVEKCISDFCMFKNSPYHNKNNKISNWEDYIMSGVFPVDTNKYIDEKNNLIVDKIIKYENLNIEMAAISKKIGFKFNGINIRAKSGFRENIIVKEEHRKIIYEAFSKSNSFTGYSLISKN